MKRGYLPIYCTVRSPLFTKQGRHSCACMCACNVRMCKVLVCFPLKMKDCQIKHNTILRIRIQMKKSCSQWKEKQCCVSVRLLQQSVTQLSQSNCSLALFRNASLIRHRSINFIAASTALCVPNVHTVPGRGMNTTEC